MMFLLHDTYNQKIYGVFSEMDTAKAFVADALGMEVQWSDPKHTVTGSVSSIPRAKNNYRITPVLVDPTAVSNLPHGF